MGLYRKVLCILAFFSVVASELNPSTKFSAKVILLFKMQNFLQKNVSLQQNF